jgi:hypothetical protein
MYEGTTTIISKYWKVYGGWNALLRSPYFHFSLFILTLTSHYWINNSWYDQPLAIIPNLLGFSLGGLAMFVSFGDEKFRNLLSIGDDVDKSIYLEFTSSFVHFIFLQILALLSGVIAKALDFNFPWSECFQKLVHIVTLAFSGLGYLLFLYSITSMIAATMAVFRACNWYQLYVKKKQEDFRD